MEGSPGPQRSSGARKKCGQHSVQEHHKDNHKGRFKEDLTQQPVPTGGENGEEPDPAFLGSLDYHNFLHSSLKVKPKVAKSPTSASKFSAPPVTPNNRLNVNRSLCDFNTPSTEFKAKSSKDNKKENEKETVLPPLSKQTSLYLSEKNSTETIKHTPALREHREQAPIEQASRPEALRKISQSDLSSLNEIPATLTSSAITPSSSPSVVPLPPGTLRSTKTLQSIPSGPLSSISYKEIDPAKLQPFIGPLTKQQPPPNRPLPQLPFPSPIKRRAHRNKSTTNMADAYKHSMEDTTEPHVGDKKGKGLRKKISKFFSGDQPSRSADTAIATGFRPLSIDTSRDSQTFSDIFDDVYKAAGGPSHTGRASHNSGHESHQISGRASFQSGGGNVSTASGDFVPRLSSQFGATGPPSRAAPTPPVSSPRIEPPPLTEHPALRDDLALQAQWGVVGTKSVSVPGPGLQLPSQDSPTLGVTRQRPAPIDTGARKSSKSVSSTFEATTRPKSIKEKPHTTIGTESTLPEDVDPLPAFDRTVDLTLYRHSRNEGDCMVAFIPRPSNKFGHVRALFIKEFANGQPFTRYKRKKRFRYFNLPDEVRFEIVRHIIADTHSETPILLNGIRQALPAWPNEAFVSLWSVLEPLQSYLWACPHLRADIMVTLLMTRSFHVIFSPFVKQSSSPLATQWFMRYSHMMQDIRLEVDMTKLGFGHTWNSTTLGTKLQDIGDLISKFTEKMLARDEKANTLGRLTLHCRRYFGYRQGKNSLEEQSGVYAYPLHGCDTNDLHELEFCEDGPGYDPNKPMNYNCSAPSLPPSAKSPYSGHRRHHADLPNRVPYVSEYQLTVADPLHNLVGLVDSVRMVGFSEDWTFRTHEALWPKEERDAIPFEHKHIHIDRWTPSRHDYVAPGHAVYFDFGICSGVHRYPPLPDSEPMVCAKYDVGNDVYVELGSGKVLTVTDDGAEFIARVQGSNLPVLARASSPKPCGPPVSRAPSAFVVKPSRIPTPKDGRNLSPMMEAMRNGTPTKAAQLLGLPGTNITNTQLSDYAGETEEDDDYATPTKSRTVSNASAMTGNVSAQPQEDHMSDLVPQQSRSSSTADTGAPRSGRLSSKRSFLLLGVSRKKST
ncbi:hypothetical protein VP1G_03164 [Cytospora mali]|uniref:Uncharacterized protein n=1 Tax=Cytospora mali TaxID=578113 RepID=A0A194UVR3_CYTMA|nr:hypothetical protein VP1G_03164 [Valsa mali var. pyri (nom. inval.)]